MLSEVTVCHPNFQPAVIEKTKIYIYNGKWEYAIETITGVLVSDRGNVEALRIYTFFLMARENDEELVLEKFDEMINALR